MKTFTIGVTAVATASPAFVAGAEARASVPTHAESIVPVSVTRSDVRSLSDALLSLSPGEKLRIAGDRIRLAKSGTSAGGPGGIASGGPGKAFTQGAQPHPAAKAISKPRTDISTQCGTREYCDKR